MATTEASPTETPKQEETAKVEQKPDASKPNVKKDDKDESAYDFDEGEEPFDFRIVATIASAMSLFACVQASITLL